MKKIAILLLVFFCILNTLYSQIDSDVRLKRKRNKYSTKKNYSPHSTNKNKKTNVDNIRRVPHELGNDIADSISTEPDLIPTIRDLKGKGNTSNISGKIIEKGTHETLMDAIIQIEDKNLATLTDPNGDFKIENIPVGKHKVTTQVMLWRNFAPHF